MEDPTRPAALRTVDLLGHGEALLFEPDERHPHGLNRHDPAGDAGELVPDRRPVSVIAKPDDGQHGQLLKVTQAHRSPYSDIAEIKVEARR
jgi:hypothetical protein